MKESNKQLITIHSDFGISIFNVYVEKDGENMVWLYTAKDELIADVEISKFKLKYYRTDKKGVKCYRLITNKEDM